MKTPTVSQKEINEQWYLIDAAGHRVGRVASIAAELLLGKNDPLVKDYLKPRKHVVVINSAKLDHTPKRAMTKFFKRYSGYPGGLTVEDLETRFKKNPNFVIEHAIKGMLPKNSRGRAIYSNLRVYAGEEHEHEAQKPEKVDITQIKL